MNLLLWHNELKQKILVEMFSGEILVEMFSGEILLIYLNFAYHWTSSASRISRKWLKSNEIFEGQIKDQIGKYVESSEFFH